VKERQKKNKFELRPIPGVSAAAPGLRPQHSSSAFGGGGSDFGPGLRPQGGGRAASHNSAASAGGSLDARFFQAQWGLDDQCAEFLETLPPAVQAIVFEKFNHEPHQTNPSARCKAFARGILQAHQQQTAEDPLITFQQQWGIDDSCLQFLRMLPPEAQSTVITDFSHQPHQTNVSARCQAFAKSVLQKQQHHQPHSTPRAAGPPAVYSSGVVPAGGGGIKRPRAEFEGNPFGGGGGHFGGGGQDANLRRFQAQWGLDDKCLSHLQSLPSQVQAIVMENFHHRPDQTNASARCMAFAKSVANTQGQQYQAMDPLSEFQAKYGLDSSCMKFIENMPAEVQSAVISGFDHQPHQTNPSARCMAFAKSVAKGMGQPASGALSGNLNTWTGWG